MDAAPASLLPSLMDASASYATTVTTAPVATQSQEKGPGIEIAPGPGTVMSTRGTSSGLNDQNGGPDRPDHYGCTPEPVSMMLMTSGLFGVFSLRRLLTK